MAYSNETIRFLSWRAIQDDDGMTRNDLAYELGFNTKQISTALRNEKWWRAHKLQFKQRQKEIRAFNRSKSVQTRINTNPTGYSRSTLTGGFT